MVITFDTDHMTDDFMEIFISMLPEEVKYTFFCTKPYVSLKGKNNIEIGAHPYLNDSANWRESTYQLIDELEQFYGVKVQGVRSHSLYSSQTYIAELDALGVEYISSMTVPFHVELVPFRYQWGPMEAPINFMDNMQLWRGGAGLPESMIVEALRTDVYRCFDFHPIHILLNTSAMDEYYEWRRSPVGTAPKMQCSNWGVADFFMYLIREAAVAKKAGATLFEVVNGYSY